MKNKEKKAAYNAAYQAANKENIAAQKAAYRAANKENIAAYQAAYKAANKDKLAAYRAANKENIAAYDAAYNAANKEKRAAYKAANKENIAAYNAAYNAANKEKRAAYRAANKENIAAQKAAYKRNRKKTDPAFKFIINLRKRQGHVLKGKASTTKGLGCTSEYLAEHLSSQFTEGMTLENHGIGEDCWHIDHIIPLVTHEKDNNEDWDVNSEYNSKLIHYTNLQPMWHTTNLQKGAMVDEKDLEEFLERVI